MKIHLGWSLEDFLRVAIYILKVLEDFLDGNLEAEEEELRNNSKDIEDEK